jgi:uncharacterized membrane protein YuzA (DUF378 family)
MVDNGPLCWTTLRQHADDFSQTRSFSCEVGMKKIDVVAAVLLVIGGLNWGLVGTLGVDLVATLFGPMSPLARTVYTLVGVAGLYQAMQWQGIQRRWLAPAHSARA